MRSACCRTEDRPLHDAPNAPRYTCALVALCKRRILRGSSVSAPLVARRSSRALTCSRALRRRGAYIAVLIALLACRADLGYGGRSTRAWIAQLDDTSSRARTDAAEALGRILAIDPGDPRVIDALVHALADSMDVVRLAAGDALATPGVSAAEAIPLLVDAAADSAHVLVRGVAVQLLGSMARTLPPREATRAGPALAAAFAVALRDPDADVRMRALDAVSRLGAPAGRSQSLVHALAELAHDPDPSVRVRVLEGYVAAAPPADTTLDVALQMLNDSSVTVRTAAAYAIARVGPSGSSPAASIDAVATALMDETVEVRTAAVVALGAMRPKGSRADSALRSALADPDSIVRREASHALQRFHLRGGRDPRPAEPTRVERCRNAPPGTREC